MAALYLHSNMQYGRWTSTLHTTHTKLHNRTLCATFAAFPGPRHACSATCGGVQQSACMQPRCLRSASARELKERELF